MRRALPLLTLLACDYPENRDVHLMGVDAAPVREAVARWTYAGMDGWTVTDSPVALDEGIGWIGIWPAATCPCAGYTSACTRTHGDLVAGGEEFSNGRGTRVVCIEQEDPRLIQHELGHAIRLGHTDGGVMDPRPDHH